MMRPAPPPLSRACALFLDVDGCLLDIADTPDGVTIPEDLPAILVRRYHDLDGAVALVSGRSISALDALFALPMLAAVGLHGAEVRMDGHSTGHPVPGALPGVAAAARALAEQWPGVVVEDKGAALALHWRLAPAAATPIRTFAGEMLAELPGYRLQHGKQVVELRPPGGTKGDAITRLLATERFAGRVPVFAGDDLTDEAGFEVVNALGGVSILIGDRSRSAAQHALPSPTTLRAWLGEPLADDAMVASAGARP